MENIFFGVLATVGILGIVFAIIHFSLRKTAPPATGAVTSPSGSIDCGKEWGKWKEKIAIPLSVVAFGAIWWLNEPNSFSRATHSRMFWSGIFLIAVLWGYFLTLPKTFKESFFRKSFMLIAFPVGLVMIFLSLVPVGKVKAEIFSTSSTPVSTQQQQKVIRVQIPANNQLSNYIKIPAGWYFRIRRPGNIELVFDNGTVVKAIKGQPLDIGHPPSWDFRFRGYPGEAVITISPDKL